MNVIDTQTGSLPETKLKDPALNEPRLHNDEAIKQLRVLFHDVRSPLTSILLWAQSLQIEAEFDAELGRNEKTDDLESSSKRMNEGALAIERNVLVQEKCIKDLENLIYKLVSR
jgi:K+-sensing histidine kinase KdpD